MPFADAVRIIPFPPACLRFKCGRCESVLILCNAVLVSKAHLAWDKYALPRIVLLW